MYRNNNFRPRHGGGNRGARRIKTIDPRFFVKKADFAVEEKVSERKFEEFEIHESLLRNIVARGYKTPTPIQEETIPHLLQGRDVVGIAATGTGKTAAFLIPLINKILMDRNQRVLIVVPTRELAAQIEDEFKIFSGNMNMSSVLCIGGVSLRPQISQLQRRPQFVIGTPGRLGDLERQRILSFGVFNTIVLDEVDRMLDMGFVREISHIISRLSSPRQSLFFSATISDSIQRVMGGFLRDPITVSVKSSESSINVDQDVVHLAGRMKTDVLQELLRSDGFDKVLVFGRTKRGVEKLAHDLSMRGLKVASIHGNKSQGQRQRAIEQFKHSGIQALLATDVASRGLDIDDITHVINFDQPESYEDYVHRIGRTGRANKKGIALTFVD